MREKLYNSEEYKKILEKKIEVKHQINMLKMDKKKETAKKNQYDYDVELYKIMKQEKEASELFTIPELFIVKYNIIENLVQSNNLTYDNFREIYDKEKPINNYDLFTTNSYEASFINNNEDVKFEVII